MFVILPKMATHPIPLACQFYFLLEKYFFLLPSSSFPFPKSVHPSFPHFLLHHHLDEMMLPLPPLLPLLLLFLILLPFIRAQLAPYYQMFELDIPLNRSDPNSAKFTLNYKLFRGFVSADANEVLPPILLGICGQHSLENCYSKMRILEEFAPRLGAAIVYTEHRFYGDKKQPTIKYDSVQSLAHLNVLEVLEDIRSVAENVAEKLMGQNSQLVAMNRTVVVGADYAAALALWLNAAERNNNGTGRARAAPKVTWLASPSPALFSEQASGNATSSSSPSPDHRLTELLVSEFGCPADSFARIFKWMDEQKNETDTVTAMMHHYNGVKERRDGVGTVKAMVLDWLRMFASQRNVPRRVEASEGSATLIWPLEKLCSSLAAVDNDNDSRGLAGALGDFIVSNEPTANLGQIDFRAVLAESLSEEQRRAKWWQKCGEVPEGNYCAKGAPEDAFYEQCTDVRAHLEKRCEQELGSLIGYNNDTTGKLAKQHLDFMADTFGGTDLLHKMRNVIITSGEFDQFAVPSQLQSDPARHFYVFPDIGLSTRGRELNVPNSCDPLAMSQARTQIVDILRCLLYPDQCPPSSPWPSPLVLEERHAFEANRTTPEGGQGQCRERLWHHYPWAPYGGDESPEEEEEPDGTASGALARCLRKWMGIGMVAAAALLLFS